MADYRTDDHGNRILVKVYPEDLVNGVFEVPGDVTTIGWQSFSGCTGLTSVVIPNSVAAINGSAFAGCLNLEVIAIDAVGDEFERVKGLLPDYLQGKVISTHEYNQIKAIQAEVCQPLWAEQLTMQGGESSLPHVLLGLVGGYQGPTLGMRRVMNTVSLPNPKEEGWQDRYSKSLSVALSNPELWAAVSLSERTVTPDARETKSQGRPMADRGDRKQRSPAVASRNEFWASDETGVSNSHLETETPEPRPAP